MKYCTKCSIEKELTEFSKNKNYSDGYSYRCRECEKERSSKYYHNNKEEQRLKQNLYNKEYVKNNRAKYQAKIRLRQAKRIQVTPVWADRNKIEEFYNKAVELTKITGVKHEVDHIVPLRNKLVSGLHNEFNLQILTAEENRRKGNRFNPDLV